MMRTKEKSFKEVEKLQETHSYAGKKRNNWWKYLLAVLICVIYLLPIYVLVIQSFKNKTDISSVLSFPQTWYFGNYINVFKDGTMLRAIKNSAIITIGSLAAEIILSCLAAYPLSRNDNKINRLILNVFLSVMMIPPLSILVGVYTLLVNIQAINTYWGIILTNTAFGIPLATFLFTNFISSIPRELDEASIIDGANVIQTFSRVILPQLKPILVSVSILQGVFAWNEYAYSIYLLQKPELQTITLVIKRYFNSLLNDYGGAAAAAIIAILPLTIIYIALQDQFIQSQVDSAIKS